MPALEISQLQLDGRKALVRCDFNVPLHERRISDPARIDASLDTIRYVLEHGGIAVLCSHLGRPKERTPELSLKPVAEYLSVALGRKIALAPDCIGEITLKLISGLKPGDALLLENLRFHPEEEANDPDFSHELARGKDLYINDAFGSAHRAHASTVGVTRFIAERAAGFLMMRELKALSRLIENPERPYVAILGGAKVSDKIGVIRNLMTRVDAILIGGAMAYTFLRVRGLEVGRSRIEEDKLQLAAELMVQATAREVPVMLPIDHVVAPSPDAGTAETVEAIAPDRMGLDIGPRTVEQYIARLRGAKTVVWNGPMGFFEHEAFAHGTLRLGEALANQENVFSVIGGGDTAAALANQPWSSRFSHISTGGGATLEYLEGIELPGVKALENRS